MKFQDLCVCCSVGHRDVTLSQSVFIDLYMPMIKCDELLEDELYDGNLIPKESAAGGRSINTGDRKSVV